MTIQQPATHPPEFVRVERSYSGGMVNVSYECPYCSRSPSEGHRSDCPLGQNLLGAPRSRAMPATFDSPDDLEAWFYSLSLKAAVLGWKNPGLQREIAALTPAERLDLAALHGGYWPGSSA